MSADSLTYLLAFGAFLVFAISMHIKTVRRKG